jgi:hypothetical protein
VLVDEVAQASRADGVVIGVQHLAAADQHEDGQRRQHHRGNEHLRAELPKGQPGQGAVPSACRPIS